MCDIHLDSVLSTTGISIFFSSVFPGLPSVNLPRFMFLLIYYSLSEIKDIVSEGTIIIFSHDFIRVTSFRNGV